MAATKVPRIVSSFTCPSCCRRRLPVTPQRAFSGCRSVRAEDPPREDPFRELSNTNNIPKNDVDPFAALRSTYSGGYRTRNSTTSALSAALDGPAESFISAAAEDNLIQAAERDQPHRLHVYSTKHNTHITFVQPPRFASKTASSSISGTSASVTEQKKQIDVLMSMSAGNIGFRKAGRGSYDAAYQLASFVLKQIQEKGMLRDIQRLEVVLRGFGAGREAVSKVILGSEGRYIRNRITSVVDATRLKQGGPRSKKPRRLG